MSRAEEDVRKALEEVLSLYDIKLDAVETPGEEGLLDDYSDIISTAQTKLDDLNEKAELIFKRVGMNRDQLEAYASNPNNFSKEQWEALQKVKEACERYKREAVAKIGGEEIERGAEKKRKKEAHRFAKRKNWIPL